MPGLALSFAHDDLELERVIASGAGNLDHCRSAASCGRRERGASELAHHRVRTSSSRTAAGNALSRASATEPKYNTCVSSQKKLRTGEGGSNVEPSLQPV